MPRRIMAGLAGLVLVAFAASSAFAYTGTVKETISCSGPTIVLKGTTVTITALVMDTTTAVSKPLAGEHVTWSYVPTSANATLSPSSGVTNSAGITRTHVSIRDASTITISATLPKGQGAQGPHCTAVLRLSGGLPDTSTVPTSDPAPGALAALVVTLGALVGAVLVARRQAPASR